MTRAPRGQNLVLLALTMLFLALMVTITLGLGMRLRQKHELQNLADASAYSNAVMTARAFNNMAAINRLEVSYWVAQAADQSLISWTGWARGLGNGAYNAATDIANSNCGRRLTPRQRDDLADFRSGLRTFVRSEIDVPGWEAMDQAAGHESRAIQGTIAGLRAELSDGAVSNSPGNLRDELFRQLKSQQLTRQIVALSRQDDVTVVPTGQVDDANSAPGVSMKNVDCDFGGAADASLNDDAPMGAGLCLRGAWGDNMLQAAMGTRGNYFVTGRGTLPPKVTSAIQQLSGGAVSVSMSNTGSAYWAALLNHGMVPRGTEAWGDDHGSVTVTVGNCTMTQPVMAHVRSTHLDNRGDQHAYNPATLTSDAFDMTPPDERAPDVHHTMGDCTPLCPSVWVRTIGFQPSDTPADAWGQPKVMVALQRDLRLRTFPWELRFKFPFSATGPESEWDGRGRELHTRVGKGSDIFRQAAVATGIAYYHRRDHWDEFPNLLNPFWRATLAPIDVDGRARDLNAALSPDEFKLQRDAYRALRAAGFEGLH